MKRKRFMLLVCTVLVLTLISVSFIFSANTPWTYVDKEAYKLIKAEGKVFAYRTMQDKDKANIRMMTSEQGVDGEAFKSNWKALRSSLVTSLNKIKNFGADNSLADMQTEDFTIAYSDIDGEKQWKFHKINNSGKAVIIPEEADNVPFQYAASKNGTEYLVASEKGLWLVDGSRMTGHKISKDNYNGKSFEELNEELIIKNTNEDKVSGLFWNINPIFSPDNTKVVYSSNRDCIQTEGYSLWIYDLKSGEEKLLVQSSGEYYICKGWLDSDIMLCQKSQNDVHTYCTIDTTGKIEELKLEGPNAEILCSSTGLIAYTPDNTLSSQLTLAKYNAEDNSLTNVWSGALDGVIRGTGSFNAEGTKYACLYAPNENEALQYLYVVDMANGTEASIKQLPVKAKTRTIINSFDWINGEQLLINIAAANNGLMDETSWTYTLEGGR